MDQYIIEREIPESGTFEHDQFKAAAEKSNEVLDTLGADIKWLHSYVAANQTFCVYEATGEAIIMKHSELSGFPANRITKIITMIDPSTAD